MYRTSATSTLAEDTEDHGNINKADSFVNGLDIHEYHYSFKDKFKFDYDYDDLNGRRLLHEAKTTLAYRAWWCRQHPRHLGLTSSEHPPIRTSFTLTARSTLKLWALDFKTAAMKRI